MNSPKASLYHRKRLIFVVFCHFFLFTALILQFYKIQIFEGKKWSKIANRQHQKTVILPAMRGRIFANSIYNEQEKQALSFDIPLFHLIADPNSMPEEKRVFIAEKIQSFLPHLSRENVLEHLMKKSRFRKIDTFLEKKVVNEMTVWWKEFAKNEKIPRNALFFEQDFKRSHPYGHLLGQVLHTVQLIKDKEGRAVPTGGLEKYFHEELEGTKGKSVILHTPRNPLGIGRELQKPKNGADIYLTINHHIQAITEEELEKGIIKAKAKGGWAVMMDPYTGEILSLAQYPFFDPNHYRSFFNQEDLLDSTRIKPVQDAFQPGSIFKPITAGICMTANEELKKRGKKPLFFPEEKIPTKDGWFPGRTKPVKDGRVHHFLNLDLALQKSSNVYFARIVDRMIKELGNQWYREALKTWGFGEKTEIELPVEAKGQIPRPGFIHSNGKLEWSLSTPYALAIGHNILVNSMQMVKAFSVIANGGREVSPILISKIKRENGVEEKKKVLGKRILNEEFAARIKRSLKFVTKFGGTSRLADIHGYTEAGKSGTSEKIIQGKYSKDHYIASFIGFAPVEHPRFVLLIVVDEPKKEFIPGVGKNYHGGSCAAPIFKEIGYRTLHYLGVEADDPCGYPFRDPRSDSKKADWSKEVKDLKKLYQEFNGT